jgi:hypothetical protein
MLHEVWSFVSVAVAVLSQWFAQQATADEMAAATVPELQPQMSLRPQHSGLEGRIGYNTQAELNDYDLMLAGGYFQSIGDKLTKGSRSGNVTVLVRVCEFTGQQGVAGSFRDKRAVRQNCGCSGLEMDYGTGNDRGIQSITMSASDSDYLSGCGRSVKIYN